MMRGWQLYPLLFIAIALWIVAMGALPTYTTQESPLLIPGLMFIMIAFVTIISTLIIYLKAPRAVAPGANFTLARGDPLKQVKVANFPNEAKGLEKYNIYALNGTPFGPIEGGKKEGFAVVPEWLDTNILGQHYWNIVFAVYRKHPNKKRGELTLDYVPQQILDSLRSLESWHPESPVLYGRIPFLKPEDAEILNVDLKLELDLVTAKNKSLGTQLETTRTALTEQTDLVKKIIQANPELAAKYAKQSRFNPFHRDEEE